MFFTRQPKEENNTDGKKYSVYMNLPHFKTHYVCDMTDESGDEAAAINDLGLTLRARLTRSKDKLYAMLEGNIFDPFRLLKSVCGIDSYSVEPFVGGVYKEGYTLLTVTADGCVNKYLIFSKYTLDILVDDLKKLAKK